MTVRKRRTLGFVLGAAAALSAAAIVVLATSPWSHPTAGPAARKRPASQPIRVAAAHQPRSRSTRCAPPAGHTMTNTTSHLCGFADTTNTGVPSGTTPYAVPGQITGPTAQTGRGWKWDGTSIVTTANNAMVKNISCSCEVVFNGYTGGTLADSDITDPNGTSDLGAVVLRHASDTTVADNDIHGANTTTQECGEGLRDVYADSQNLTFENNNVWYCAVGLNNVTLGGLIEQNYIHDFSTDSTSHYEAIQTEDPGSSTALTIRDNTFFNQHSQTAAIILSNDAGGIETNRIINHNLLGGGDYCFYGAGRSSTHSSDITFTNNSFSRLYYSNCGYYGPDAYWTPGSGNVWSRNIWDDSGALVGP